jgi:MFS family permease
MTISPALPVLQREWGMSAAAGSTVYIVGLFHLMGMPASLSMDTLSDRLGRCLVILLAGSQARGPWL